MYPLLLDLHVDLLISPSWHLCDHVSLKKEIKRRLKSDTCWACQYKSSLDSYRRNCHAVRKALMEVSEPHGQDNVQHLAGCPCDERLVSLSTCLRVMRLCGLSWFPQLLESRGPVPWVESLLSFLSTAFQRKCGHLRGESGKFWVLAQIAGQKEFPLPQCRVNKTGKRNFPLYFCTFWNTVSFFQGHCYGNSLTSAPRKGEHSEKLLSKCDFFFHWLPHSLSYDRLSGPSTHREVIVTELRDSMLWGSE